MKPFISVLYLEDEPNDVKLVEAKLEEAEFSYNLTVVQSQDEFEKALQQDEYDIVLSDFSLPMYDGLSALQHTRKLYPDIPFVFVSGTMGEEAAIKALKLGATDYILKQKMLRLASAVKRALHEAENHREHERINNIRKARFRLLEFANSNTKDELMTATLDEIEVLTSSSIGFYHFLKSDQKTLILQNWSTNTMKNMCITSKKGSQRKIDNSCIWGDCVYEHHAVIQNDCSSLHQCDELPDEHTEVFRELVVPIIRGNLVKAIIGVCNKSSDYNEYDIEIASQLGDLSWDIVERMKAEEALRESEEKYRLLITNAGEAIFIIQDEIVKFPNPKTLEMIGYSAEELAEIHFNSLVHPEDKDKVSRNWLGLQAEGKHPETFPFRIVNKMGKEIWVHLTTATIDWEKKKGILCFLRDITEEKKLEAQFMQAQKMEAVGQLAGGVAHDFNNMLMLIIGYAELALMKINKSDPLYSQLQEINNAAQRSADLTGQLLAFARKQTIAPKVLNLNNTMSGLLKMLQRLIGEDIDLVWKPGQELWSVKIDPIQIDQVLANLGINARDSITGMGNITIETANISFDEAYCNEHSGFIPGEFVLLSVSDNGCGMDKEIQSHLFEPFFTTKGIGQGTGLGLATVYGIVKQNQGFIIVHSESGKGTRFEIYLPRFKLEPVKPMIKNKVEKSLGGKETVLIVEDEKAILDLGKKILDRLGYTILIAKTPGEAIQQVKNHKGEIHLLITDVVMPEMNGKDLVTKLSSVKPGIKCLYMSGYTADVISNHGILEDGINFIQKPFSVNDFASSVRKVLDTKLTESNKNR